MTDDKETCSVCFEERTDFWKCTQCIHKYCFHCFVEIMKGSRQKCPYCNIPFKHAEEEPEFNIESLFRWHEPPQIPVDTALMLNDLFLYGFPRLAHRPRRSSATGPDPRPSWAVSGIGRSHFL